MRIRLPLGRTVFFGSALLIALIALLPLRLALGWLKLDEAGLSAREASGSVWTGALRDTRLGAVVLGDIGVGLSPLQLLVGRARLDAKRADGLRGAASVTRRSTGLDDLTGTLAVGTLFAPLPIATLDLTDLSIRFRDGGCETAEGLVRATVSGELAGINLAQGLSGTARCDRGALLLPLASQSGGEGLALRITADGRYDAVLSAKPGDPALAAKLIASGFAAGADGYTLTMRGRF